MAIPVKMADLEAVQVDRCLYHRHEFDDIINGELGRDVAVFFCHIASLALGVAGRTVVGGCPSGDMEWANWDDAHA